MTARFRNVTNGVGCISRAVVITIYRFFLCVLYMCATYDLGKGVTSCVVEKGGKMKTLTIEF